MDASTPPLRGTPGARDARSFAYPASLAVLCSVLATWLARTDPWSTAAIQLWLLSIALIAGAAHRYDHIGLDRLRVMARSLVRYPLLVELSLVAVLTALAFAMRAYDLGNLPGPMHGDEGEMGVRALQVLDSSAPPPFFETSWLGHPSLFHYLQAASLAVFGRNETGLRMLSAIFGALCVPLVYAIGRIGWGRLAGFVAAWLLAVSHLHIHYSRVGLNNIESVWAMCLLMVLLAMAHSRASRPPRSEGHERQAGVRTSGGATLYVLAGLTIGAAQYFYHGSRLLAVIGALLLGFMWRTRCASLAQVSLVLLAAFIAFAPLGRHYVEQPEALLGRITTVSIFTEQNLRHTLGPQSKWPEDALRLLGLQLQRNIGLFVDGRDRSGFYLADLAHFPGFDTLTKLLFWLGLGFCLACVNRYPEFSLVAWLSLGVLLAGVATVDSPNGPRLLLAVPAVFLLGAIAVKRCWQMLAPILGVSRRRIGAAALLAMLSVGLASNTWTYFVLYAQNAEDARPIAVAREMVAEPPSEYQVYLIGSPVLYADHGVLRFIARGARARNLSHAGEVDVPAGKGLLVVALAADIETLNAVRAAWPGGAERRRMDHRGRLVYVAYRIRPPVAARNNLISLNSGY